MRIAQIWLWAAVIALMLATAVVTWHHEPWLDETDPWLLMRDGGIATMLHRTGYLGAPALWYLAVWPFAAAGLPFASQQVLNLVLAWAAVALFVAKSPFRPWLKVAFLFSYFIAYEFTVIARSYSLLMLLLFGVAAAWPRRDRWPIGVAVLVVLLANVAGQSLVIAAAIGALLLFESVRNGTIRRGRSATAICLMLAGGLAAAAQMWVPPDGPRLMRHVDPGTLPYAIGAMLLPFTDPKISFPIGLLLLLITTVAVARKPAVLVMMWGAVGCLFVLYQFVWYGGVRHSGVLLLLVIFSLWIAADYTAGELWRDRAYLLAEIALAAGLLLSVPTTIWYWRTDFRLPFSASREMGRFIAGHVPPNVTIAAYPTIQCEPVLAYVPGRKFWYVALGRYGSYMEWGRALDQAQLRRLDPATEARRHFGSRGWFLMTAQKLSRPDANGVRLVYATRQPFGASAEWYWLYEPSPDSQ